MRIVEAGASADFAIIEAAAGEDGVEKLPSFSMTAYTGGKLNLSGWPAPVVVDLSGVKIPAKSIPILIAHNHENPLGHTDSVVINDSSIRITGTQSVPSVASNAVIQAGRNKFPWQASIGAVPTKAVFVEAGESVEVNGRTFRGPTYVVRSSVLRETSFVTLGADGQTSATVTASFSEGEDMKFSEWLKARGLDESTIEASALELLKADFEALEAAASDEVEEDAGAPIDAGADVVKASRKAAVDEIKRQEAITKLTANHADIRAEAIDKGWDATQTELAVLRARAKSNPGVSQKGAASEMGNQVIEAAIASTCGLKSREGEYDEQTLEASDKLKGFGLQELIAHFAARNGYHSNRSVLRGDGAIKEAIRAAFSTNEISTTLSNVANKFSREAFMAVEQVWRAIAAIRSASNFQAMTGVSLAADMTYKKVNPQGQIEMGKIGEVTYSNQVDEYGRILGVSRKDIINDNTGALSAAGRMMGRGGGLAINQIFWAAFQAAGFFSSTAVTTAGQKFNSNLSASTALTIAGLTAAELLFNNQVDPFGNPLGSTAKILLTGNDLKQTARQLMNSTTLPQSTLGDNNPFAGQFDPFSSAYLATGAWHLLADPQDIPVMEVAFLNGQEEPVVESFDAAPDQLGMLWRGVYDFGCARVEKRGAVKATV